MRFDDLDQCIAAGHSDGTIRIYDVMAGKEISVINRDMENPMPMKNIKWRPPAASSTTQNVMISVNANGSLQHWQTSSGQLLNTISDYSYQHLGLDYRFDGCMFASGGSDSVVRVYDESTMTIVSELTEGVNNKPAHTDKVLC